MAHVPGPVAARCPCRPQPVPRGGACRAGSSGLRSTAAPSKAASCKQFWFTAGLKRLWHDELGVHLVLSFLRRKPVSGR